MEKKRKWIHLLKLNKKLYGCNFILIFELKIIILYIKKKRFICAFSKLAPIQFLKSKRRVLVQKN